MNKHLKIICLVLVTSSSTIVYGQPKIAHSANKNAIFASVAKQESVLIDMSYKIWSYAETALGESKSSKIYLIMRRLRASLFRKGTTGAPSNEINCACR